MLTIAPSGGSVALQQTSVDWITVTAADEHDRVNLQAIALGLKLAEERAGNKVSGKTIPRYRGFSVGGVRYGEREEDVICALSSYTASQNWYRLMPYARNVSRLDLQCTFVVDKPHIRLAEEFYAESQNPTGKRGRPYQATLVLNSAGGATCYLGSRSSDRSIRVYDKGVESGEAPPGMLWRVEAEFHSGIAFQAASSSELLSEPLATIPRIIAAELDRKVARPVDYPDMAPLSVEVKRQASTVETKLRWLATQVKPTIVWLEEQGYGDEALAALGL